MKIHKNFTNQNVINEIKSRYIPDINLVFFLF